jgi:hypothetical protein
MLQCASLGIYEEWWPRKGDVAKVKAGEKTACRFGDFSPAFSSLYRYPSPVSVENGTGSLQGWKRNGLEGEM